MKLSKPFTCVLPGEIHPVELSAGEECPEEYEDSARAQGCLAKGQRQPKADQAEPATAETAAAEQEPATGGEATASDQTEGGEQSA